MTAELTILPEEYNEIAKGNKYFIVAKDNKNYSVGDYVVLREWDNVLRKYTGKTMDFKITYVLRDKKYCKDGYVIMSITEYWA